MSVCTFALPRPPSLSAAAAGTDALFHVRARPFASPLPSCTPPPLTRVEIHCHRSVGRSSARQRPSCPSEAAERRVGRGGDARKGDLVATLEKDAEVAVMGQPQARVGRGAALEAEVGRPGGPVID